ncbi:solute carrier organic anion transporter family member 3A1 [Puma concolor]|uniref:Solute carrier organic anion transporter family member n=1 Tax=Puma concolor TaxID=9696 RepID=A0A6P6HHL3_PUMCO|nr:solute carrier organic anion transporter family member 3A1 [Puma concolor]
MVPAAMAEMVVVAIVIPVVTEIIVVAAGVRVVVEVVAAVAAVVMAIIVVMIEMVMVVLVAMLEAAVVRVMGELMGGVIDVVAEEVELMEADVEVLTEVMKVMVGKGGDGDRGVGDGSGSGVMVEVEEMEVVVVEVEVVVKAMEVMVEKDGYGGGGGDGGGGGGGNGATNMMYLLLIGAQVLLGIGATPVQPLGVSYIDDHVRRKDSSLYIGILFTMLVFGPACGFILGSFCTKIYVDAVFIDTSNLDITPDDPRWIGAWWGGFLLCGALLFFSSLLMFGFPQSLPPHSDPAMESEQAMLPEREYERPKPSNGVLRHPLEPDSSASCFQQLKVIPKVTKHLLSNPVFTCIILAACMEIAVVAGFAAFLGKYLEQQFNLTTSSANQLLGMTAIPCACLGIFLGGLLVKKLSLSALGAIRMAMLVNLVSTACYVSFLFLGCDTGPVAGVTVPYGNTSAPGVALDPYSPCNKNCECQTDSFTPVCGADGITYLSACFAGCNSTNLTGCACLTTVPAENTTVVPGKCPSPGCQEAFLTFLCVMCVCSMIGAMAQTPSVIILIRTVSPELKSYALGVLFLLLRLLGFIPPPLIFGAGIDSTCLFWSTFCGEQGACVLYDNVAYRYLYVSIAIVLKSSAFVLYTTTWQCLRKNYKRYIKNHEGGLSTSEFFASTLTLDNLGRDPVPASQTHRTKFIYNLEDHEWCENMESVL